jgi:hypothetical protein
MGMLGTVARRMAIGAVLCVAGALSCSDDSSGTGGSSTNASEGACGPFASNPKYCVCASFQQGSKKTCSGEDLDGGKALCLKGVDTKGRCECRPFVCVKNGDYCQCGVNYAGETDATLASVGFHLVESCTAKKCATSRDGGVCQCGESGSDDIEVASCSLQAVIEAIEADERAFYRAGTKCSADGTLQ